MLTLVAQMTKSPARPVDRSSSEGMPTRRADLRPMQAAPLHAAFEEKTSWDDRFGGPGPNGNVYAIVASGTDVYVGGDFTMIGNVRANRVARWDGHVWHPLGTDLENGVDYLVLSILVDGDNVYVGGQFVQAGPIEATNMAVWNRSSNSWSAVGGGLKGDPNALVSAIVKSGGNIYVGGRFAKAGDVTAVNVARWDGSAWAPVAGGVDGVVGSMAATANEIYVGGTFTHAGSTTAQNIASYAITQGTWSALGSGIDGSVRTILVNGADVYVGGVFTNGGGIGAKHLARWNSAARTWSKFDDMIDNGAVESGVHALAIDADYLYVGGDFRMGQKTTWDRIDSVRCLARWNFAASKWEAMGESVIEYDNQAPQVNTIALVGRKLYLGGHFPMAGFYEASNLAQYDLDNKLWTSLTSGINGGTGGYIVEGKKQARDTMGVRALTMVGNWIYVGGVFNTAGGVSARSIARFDGQQWQALGAGLTDSKLVFPGPPMVLVIAAIGNDIWAGGRFNMAGDQAAKNIARWDGTSWTALPAPPTPANAFDSVTAIVGMGTNVYVGGIARVGGIPRGIVYRWNGTQWDTLGFSFDRAVRALAVHNNLLYIGGEFTTAGSTPARGLAVYDPATSQVSAVANGPNGNVRAIAVSGNDMYIGGDFTAVGSTPAARIVLWHPGTSSWTALGDGFGKAVRAIAVTPAGVFVGGDFDSGDGSPGNFIARWDGTAWSPMGDGTDSRVFAVAGSNDDIYIGGHFWMAGGLQSHYLAHWSRVLLSVDREENNGSISSIASLASAPNPFAATTELTLSLAERAPVSVVISSPSGNVVATLVDRTLDPGEHRFSFSGDGLSNGIYFCTLRVGDRVATQKLVLVK